MSDLPAWMMTVRAETTKGARSVPQLHDPATGQVLAIMDAGHLTVLRSSLMSALAADVLARPRKYERPGMSSPTSNKSLPDLSGGWEPLPLFHLFCLQGVPVQGWITTLPSDSPAPRT